MTLADLTLLALFAAAMTGPVGILWWFYSQGKFHGMLPRRRE